MMHDNDRLKIIDHWTLACKPSIRTGTGQEIHQFIAHAGLANQDTKEQ